MRIDDLIKEESSAQSLQNPIGERNGLAKNLGTILNVVRTINTSLVLSEVLELVTIEAIRMARANRGFLMLTNGDENLQFAIGMDSDGSPIPPDQFSISMSVLEDVFKTGESICIEHALNDERFVKRQSILNLELQTILCTPLKTRDERIGVLYVDSKSVQTLDRTEILHLFEIIAGQAAIAIKNARLYDDLRRAYDELKAANQYIIDSERLVMKGELASEISHELKNLVAVVLLHLQRLQIKFTSVSPEEISSLIETTIKGVKRIEGFSGNLLTRTPATSRRIPSDINKLVSAFMEFLNHLPRFRNNRITLLPGENLPLVLIDTDQMQQVLLNLSNNAVEADADTSLQFSTLFDPATGNVQLCVKDSGPGIEMEILDRLFQEKITTKPSGHGYGLHICKQIVERQGGTISVESIAGEGATFTIRFPAVKQ